MSDVAAAVLDLIGLLKVGVCCLGGGGQHRCEVRSVCVRGARSPSFAGLLCLALCVEDMKVSQLCERHCSCCAGSLWFAGKIAGKIEGCSLFAQ